MCRGSRTLKRASAFLHCLWTFQKHLAGHCLEQEARLRWNHLGLIQGGASLTFRACYEGKLSPVYVGQDQSEVSLG